MLSYQYMSFTCLGNKNLTAESKKLCVYLDSRLAVQNPADIRNLDAVAGLSSRNSDELIALKV